MFRVKAHITEPLTGQQLRVPAVIRKRRGQCIMIQPPTRKEASVLRGVLKQGMCLFLFLKVCIAVSAQLPTVHPANGRLIEGSASGYRVSASGAVSDVGSNGIYWTFAPASQQNARNLNFNSGNVNPLGNNNRATGFPVRPSRESYRGLPRMGHYSFKTVHALVTKAYLKARESERGTTAQLAFEVNQEEEIFELSMELFTRTWRPGHLDWFVLTDPSVREVFAPQFRDRVVSHVLFDLIGPIFERYFIHDTYSCRIGRGTLFGIERLEHHIRSVTDNYTLPAWCLNLDISGYFMAIIRPRLYTIVSDTLTRHSARYPDAIDYDFADYLNHAFLMREPLVGCVYHGNPNLQKLVLPEKSLRGKAAGIGLPIGDVINQLYSNVYLSPYDQFVKRELGIRAYSRYVDDEKMLHGSYDYLVECKERSATFLRDELGLTLHPNKTTITDVRDGVSFLGAILLPYRRYVKDATVARFVHFVESTAKELTHPGADVLSLRSGLNSYLGYLGKFDAFRVTENILNGTPELSQAFVCTPNLSKATFRI